MPKFRIIETLISKKYLYFLLILGLSFALFGTGIKGDFVSDDKLVISGNPLVIEANINNVYNIFKSPYHYKQSDTGLYRPLTLVSYYFNWRVFGGTPTSFHVVNIILHASIVFCLFLLLDLLVKDKYFALLASIIFLFMPIHTEAVTWIAGRADLLATLFALLALYFDAKNRIWWSSITFLLALLSKESAIAFIGLWFFIELFVHKQKLGLLVNKAFYYITVLVLYFGLRYAILKEYFISSQTSFIDNPIKHLPVVSGFFTSLKVLFLYVQKTVFPTTLSSDYSYNQIRIVDNIFKSPEALVGLLILSVLVFVAWRYKNSVYGLAAIFFLFPYFIISNFVLKTGTIMAERLIYFPSIGLAMFLALGIKHLLSYKKIRVISGIILIGLLIFYSIKSIDRNYDWLTDKSLYESAYAAAPDSVRNMTNGAYMMIRYDNNLREAKVLIDKAIEIGPNHLAALNMGGVIYDSLGDKTKAQQLWERALEINPTYIRSWGHLVELYYETKQWQAAEDLFEKTLNWHPNLNEVYALLALTKFELKKYDEVIAIFEKHLGENPNDPDLIYVLGSSYLEKGNLSKAEFYLDQYNRD